MRKAAGTYPEEAGIVAGCQMIFPKYAAGAKPITGRFASSIALLLPAASQDRSAWSGCSSSSDAMERPSTSMRRPV